MTLIHARSSMPARPRSLALFLDIEKAELRLDGMERLRDRLERADVVIESSAPAPLEPLSEPLEQPNLVRVYLSPFGLSGPYRSFRSTAFTDDAIGGHLYLNGEPDRQPLARPGYQAHYQAGAHGFIGALAALWARERIGRGQTVEVSHHEGLASLHQYTTVMWTQAGHKLRREGNRQGGHFHPVGIYRCRDGYVSLAMPAGIMLEPFLHAAGLAHLLDDPRFADDYARGRHKDEFDAALRPWLMSHTASEIIELGQRAKAPIGPVPDLLSVLDDPHLVARRCFATLPDGGAEPQTPVTPFRIERRGPPLGAQPTPSRAPRFEPTDRLRAGPLDGVRVLDLTRVWAGPLATRILADLGAEVIKVEATWARGPAEVPAEAARTHLYADNQVGDEPFNRNIAFNKLNRNKRSLTLQLDRAAGKRLFEQLVRQSHVVIDNFSPRVMPQLGLGYEQLRQLNEEIVVVTMPGFGATGPYRDWLAYGPLIESASGLNAHMGYEDSGPYRSGVAWPDPVTSLHAAAATLVALHEARCDTEQPSRRVETAMIDAMLFTVGDQLIEAQLAGVGPPRRGSRQPGRLQGCYPCRGDDQWIALCVGDRRSWQRLAAYCELAEALRSLPLSAAEARHDDVDRQLAAFTRTRSAKELMVALQSRGVVAAVVADAPALVDDEQLAARGFWVELDHARVGQRRYPGQPIRLSETPATFRTSAPLLGEHNREILGERLALSDREIRALERDAIIAQRPPPGATARGIADQPTENTHERMERSTRR